MGGLQCHLPTDVSCFHDRNIKAINNVAVFMNTQEEFPEVEPEVAPVRFVVTEGAYAPEDLPLRVGPLRFALVNAEGFSSDSWIVRVGSRGDVYVVCREADLEIKVSLHESGLQKFSYQRKWRDDPIEYEHRWVEHGHYRGNRARPSFALILPTFGLYLDEEWRRTHPRTWLARHLLLQAPQQPLATLVAFAIVDEDVSIMDIVGYAVLAELPTRPGKKLCVIAGSMSEARFLLMLQSGMEGMLRESSPKDLMASFDEPFRVVGLHFPDEGGPWMYSLPVQLTRGDTLASNTTS